MANFNYTFQMQPYDPDLLLPQVRTALEKRTELISRERYAGMWRQTDHFNAAATGSSHSTRPRRLRNIAYLTVGIFLLVPGLVNPQELWLPLLAGIAAVAIGIVGLFHNKKNPFAKAAKLLLDRSETLSQEPAVTVSFCEQGMTLPTDNGGNELVPYTDFERIIETADALLLVYGERVTLLQKKDLTTANILDFSAFLSQKVAKYHSI